MSDMITSGAALLSALPHAGASGASGATMTYLPADSTDKQEMTGISAIAKLTADKLAEISAQAEYASVFSAIDKLPERVLDILASDLKIQWYEQDAPLTAKRQAVRECISIHRHKGTKYAVETALKSIYENVRVEEWNEYGGEPFHFRIIIYDSSNDRERRNRVLAKVRYYKNIRSVYEGTVYEISSSGDIGVRAAIRPCGIYKTIYSEVKNYG